MSIASACRKGVCSMPPAFLNKKRRNTWALVVLFFLLITVWLQRPVWAGGVLTEKRVILVLAAGLSLDRLSAAHTPHLYALMKEGAVGMMSTNTAARSEEAAYATIGSGNKVLADKLAGLSFGKDEKVDLPEEYQAVTGRELYQRYMGGTVQGEVLFPYFASLDNTNQSLPYRFALGSIGEQIHHLGGKTAVIGNSDLGNRYYRLAPLVAMDAAGQTDFGRVGPELLCPDPAQPFGVRTDYGKLYRSFLQIKDRASLTVIETGDLLRLRAEKDQMDPSVMEQVYGQDLARLDGLIGRLLPLVNGRTLLIVASPISFADMGIGQEGLAPLLMAGGEVLPGGLLQSNTTKIRGLVTNYDLAPTILSFLGGNSTGESILGQVITSESHEGAAPEDLLRWSATWELPNRGRTPVLRVYVELLLVLLILTLLADGWKGRRKWKYFPLIRTLLEYLLVIPLSLLIVPVFQPESVLTTLVWLAAVSLMGIAGLSMIQERMRRLLFLAGGTTASLIGDMLTGSVQIRQSLLGYDVIGGARYYGIGNEYMGVLIGSSLLFVCAWMESMPRYRKRILLFALFLFLGEIYLLAAPQFGTNAGGALAAVIGYTYALCLFARVPSPRRKGWFLTGATVLGFAVILILNLVVPAGEQTHIGRAGFALLQGDLETILSIIVRKATLNLRLLVVSLWGKLFLVTLIGLCLYLFRFTRGKMQPRSAIWTKGLRAALVTGLAVFALNDSGVVAAASILLYMVVPVIGYGQPMIRPPADQMTGRDRGAEAS
jgi:hypothetical protein